VNDSPDSARSPLTLCVFHAEHAEGVVACVSATYGPAYPQRELYDATALLDAVDSGRWMANVAVDADGQVVGCSVLQPSRHGPVAEYGMVMVMPGYRRLGVAEMLRDFALQEARRAGLAATYVEVGTVSPGAQAIADRAAIVPCGLTLAHWPDFSSSAAGVRLSFVRYARCLSSLDEAELDLPPRHHHVAQVIRAKLGASSHFVARDASGPSTLHVDRYPHIQCMVITVEQLGEGARDQLAEHMSRFDGDPQLLSAYLDLPVCQPGAAELCRFAEAHGFFFGSLTPRLFGRGDGLRLQRLKTDPAIERLVILNPLARQLVQHMAAERQRVEQAFVHPARDGSGTR
jgi:GNAT superfamily N-acetyltransferase